MSSRHPFTPRSLGFEREKPLESVTFFILLSFIASAPMQWGGVLPEGLFRIQLFAFAIAALTLISRAPLAPLRGMATPLLLLTALASLGLLQLIPLPMSALETISSSSAAVYSDTAQILGVYDRDPITARISIFPSQTARVTLFVLALAALGASSAILLASRRRRRMFLAVFLGAAVLQAVTAVSQFGPRATGRISGPFINPNHFAGYLEVALACAFAVLWRESLHNRDRARGAKDRGERIEKRLLPIGLATLLFATIATAVGLTKSRGGIAAAVAMLLVAVSLGLLHKRLVKRRIRLATLGVAALVIGLLFVAATVKSEPLLRFLEADPREIAADTRVLLWSTSIDAWERFPLFGSGLGTFREAYRPVQPREIRQLVEQAHSDPIQILVTGGLIGFLLAMAAWISCLTILLRRFREQPHREESSFTLGGIAALLTLGLHGLVEFNFSIPAIPATLACVVGLAFASADWRQPGPREVGDEGEAAEG